MFRSLLTIIRELYLYLAKVIFMLKHSVKLHRYIYLVSEAACRRAACAALRHAASLTRSLFPFVFSLYFNIFSAFLSTCLQQNTDTGAANNNLLTGYIRFPHV